MADPATPERRWRLPPSQMYGLPEVLAGQRCAVHVYDAVALGLKEPYRPFPTILSAVDQMLRAATADASVSDVLANGGGPRPDDGAFKQPKGWLKAEFTAADGGVFEVKGRTDTLIAHPDGTVSVADFKHRPIDAAEPMAERAQQYAPQLAAYVALLRESGRRTRTDAWVIWCGPHKASLDSFACAQGSLWADYPLQPSKVDVRDCDYAGILDQMEVLLSGPRPEPAPDCADCAYHAELVKLSLAAG